MLPLSQLNVNKVIHNYLCETQIQCNRDTETQCAQEVWTDKADMRIMESLYFAGPSVWNTLHPAPKMEYNLQSFMYKY